MARIAAIISDLMLGSKVTETLSSAGHEVERRRVDDPAAAGAELIVADLDAVDAESVAGVGPPTLGFCRHTDVERRRAAEDAGVDLVVPRSRIARELPELAARLLRSSAPGP